MSVRFFYVDESYDKDRFCLSAIGIRHSHWDECFKRVKEHRTNLKNDVGMFIRREIHAHEFVAGRGNVSDRIIGKHERSRIFRGVLSLVSQLPEVILINVCLSQSGRKRGVTQMLAWDRLLNRIERTLLAAEQREIPERRAASDLIRKSPPQGTRPEWLSSRILDYNPRAVIIADQGREGDITKAYRKMMVYNPIPSQFGEWKEGGFTKNTPMERMIEDPVFKQSHQSFLIQLADCVAFALLKKESPPTPNIEKHGIHLLFDEVLSAVCFKDACKSDPLGIVRK